jgi:hypothetical protein
MLLQCQDLLHFYWNSCLLERAAETSVPSEQSSWTRFSVTEPQFVGFLAESLVLLVFPSSIFLRIESLSTDPFSHIPKWGASFVFGFSFVYVGMLLVGSSRRRHTEVLSSVSLSEPKANLFRSNTLTHQPRASIENVTAAAVLPTRRSSCKRMNGMNAWTQLCAWI